MGSIVLAGALPESKCVDHDDIRSTDDGIAGSISKFVPRVGGSDLDALGQLGLDGADLVLELLAGEVSTVESLGTNGYGVDAVGVLLGNVGDGLEILVEGLFDIGPSLKD